MAEVSFGIGKAGFARGAFAGAGREVKRGTGAKGGGTTGRGAVAKRGAATGRGAVAKRGAATGRGTEAKTGGGRRERSGNRVVGGAARLREAVDRKLRRSSGELANMLLDKARKGDMPSLRLLVSLAERHKPEEKVVDPGPAWSQALAWAAEPQWVDPPEEEGNCGECR